ncbi:MAG: prepilin-type N-terminal cleavage/methylation domain-containing protein [Actinobacteria bacterium]|nr:prepilin-type N-terminal cleavage/methylation domain-containing protein [Actinomycetota bacterium]
MKLTETRASRQEGFTLVELMVVVLIAGIISVTVLTFYLSALRSTADQTTRIQNQDSARFAMYEMSRYIRGACDSDSNQTSIDDSLALARPQEMAFYADVDGDGSAEKLHYYLSGTTLKMELTEPDTGTIPPTYPAQHQLESLVILDGIRNGSDPIFSYYAYNEGTGAIYQIADPNSADLRRAVVAVGIDLSVNEKPELARRATAVSTRVQLRGRNTGDLDGG